MPYYLVPFVRPDGRSRGRRPRGYDHASHNFITLGKGEGARALIWFGDPFDDPAAEKIADGADETLAVATRAIFRALVSDRQYRDADQRFDLSVVELLKRPPTGWSFAPLRPSLRRRRYEVWLGPGGRGKNLFYAEAVAPDKHSKSFVDNFNRANAPLSGSTLSGGGATWDTSSGDTDNWAIVGNRARSATNSAESYDVARVNPQADTDDLTASAALVTYTQPDASWVDVSLDLGVGSGGGGFSMRIGSDDSGSYTFRRLDAIFQDIELDSDFVITTSGTLGLVRDGSSIEALLNGSTLFGPFTNTGEPTGAGNRALEFALEGIDDVGGTRVVEFDNFVGGDLVQPAPISIVMHHLHQQGIA